MTMGINTNYRDYYNSATSTQQTTKMAEADNAAVPQTLDDFKRDIYDTISKMKVHPSQSQTQISVNISDKAFEKMMNDPDYKNLMLKTIQRDLNGAYPGGGAAPSYSIITIGNDCEYRADAYGSAYGDVFSAKSANSFWEKNTKKAASSYDDSRRKTQNNTNYQDISAKKLTERRLQEKRLSDKEYEEKIREQKQVQSAQLQKALAGYENNMITEQ